PQVYGMPPPRTARPLAAERAITGKLGHRSSSRPTMTYLLALDQGTSSPRSIAFNAKGEIVTLAQREITQIFPRPGWVEHAPMEIWRTQLETAREALAKAGLKAADIRAIGITNQRETTLVWNRRSGQPIHNAIVWQD